MAAFALYVFAAVCFLVFPSHSPCTDPQSREPGLNPSFTERELERKQMVDTQLRGLGRTEIDDPAVLKSMLTVPRHAFVPVANQRLAYTDGPVPIGHGQTISQPYIVALMTQALQLKSGMKILEIGTGSGYQAAILAEITPLVFTIEIVLPLYETATSRLKNLGYSTIKTLQSDGYYGWQEFAFFDRIIVTCAALHVPQPLFEQLTPGGKMVIPVGGNFETQRLLLVTKDADGKRRSETLTLVRFVPLIRSDPTEASPSEKSRPLQP